MKQILPVLIWLLPIVCFGQTHLNAYTTNNQVGADTHVTAIPRIASTVVNGQSGVTFANMIINDPVILEDPAGSGGGGNFDYANNAVLSQGTLRISSDGVLQLDSDSEGDDGLIFINTNSLDFTALPANQPLTVVGGNLYVGGKLTVNGGTDPPYVLYDAETEAQIKAEVEREVPTNKLSGAALFWNPNRKALEVYLPNEDNFYDVNGKLLASNVAALAFTPYQPIHTNNVVTNAVPTK